MAGLNQTITQRVTADREPELFASGREVLAGLALVLMKTAGIATGGE